MRFKIVNSKLVLSENKYKTILIIHFNRNFSYSKTKTRPGVDTKRIMITKYAFRNTFTILVTSVGANPETFPISRFLCCWNF